jgi:hypothetical protein
MCNIKHGYEIRTCLRLTREMQNNLNRKKAWSLSVAHFLHNLGALTIVQVRRASAELAFTHSRATFVLAISQANHTAESHSL